ncbi:hypothetical protein ACFX1X_035497 [Malus domestica]
MIMEFIAFVKLRMNQPAASRPFKIPVGTVGAILICIPPTLLIFVVLALATPKVMVISIAAMIIGLLLQPCIEYTKNKRWFNFSTKSDLPDIHNAYDQCSIVA